jgi:hypothetical protein
MKTATKKKGLGADINKSLEVISGILTELNKLSTESKMPIKRGLKSNGMLDEKMSKMVNEARKLGIELSNQLEDIQDAISQEKKNNRFAKRVVAKFLSD